MWLIQGRCPQPKNTEQSSVQILVSSLALPLGHWYGGLWRIHTLKWEEFKIVVLVEPGALKVLERKIKPSAQCQRVDGELHVSVRFLFRVGLVVEDV